MTTPPHDHVTALPLPCACVIYQKGVEGTVQIVDELVTTPPHDHATTLPLHRTGVIYQMGFEGTVQIVD